MTYKSCGFSFFRRIHWWCCIMHHGASRLRHYDGAEMLLLLRPGHYCRPHLCDDENAMISDRFRFTISPASTECALLVFLCLVLHPRRSWPSLWNRCICRFISHNRYLMRASHRPKTRTLRSIIFSAGSRDSHSRLDYRGIL
jgi:hypothetical protein